MTQSHVTVKAVRDAGGVVERRCYWMQAGLARCRTNAEFVFDGHGYCGSHYETQLQIQEADQRAE